MPVKNSGTDIVQLNCKCNTVCALTCGKYCFLAWLFVPMHVLLCVHLVTVC